MSPAVIQMFTLILVFGSVFLLVEYALGSARLRHYSAKAINLRLKMIEDGRDREQIMHRLRKQSGSDFEFLPNMLKAPVRKIERLVQAARITLPARQVLLLMLGATGLLFSVILLGAAYAGFGISLGIIELGAALSICVGIFLPAMLLSRRAQKLRQRVQEQFPAALDIFVRGLRSGHPIASALSLLAEEMDDPLGSEFGLIVDEISYGADLQSALLEFADRWDLEDIHMFVVSLSVQNETGGNLAEVLDNLSKVIRDRASMLLKVRALSSEGRMSAKMLTALPIITFVSMFLVNPGFYLEYAQTAPFIVGFTLLIGLYLLGALWIRKLVDLHV